MFGGHVSAAIGSLRLSKWRSIFTMLGIIIGICSVVTIVSLGEGLKHQIVGQINDLGSDVVTVRPGKLVSHGPNGQTNLNLLALLSISTFTPEDVKTVQNLPSVKTAVPIDFVTNTAVGNNNELDNVFVAGTTGDMANLLHVKVNYGGFFDSSDDTQNVAVIGREVALRMYGEENPVGNTINISGQDFIVHGVLAQSASGVLSIAQADFNYAVFIPFQPALDLANGHANILQILAKSQKPKDVDQTIQQINSTLKQAHGQQDFSVLKQYELVSIAGDLVNSATGFITAIAAISLLVGGLGIMDIMLVNVSERNREIGIRKAVGATNRQILMQFLTEGLVLTIGGGIIGILLSLLINALIRIYSFWEPVINIWVLAIAVSFSILVGLIFSTIPALQAARKNPIDALRGD
jgi:putative ABC transport system permease protein